MSERTGRLLKGGSIAALVLLLLADFFIHHHEHFGVEDTFGFYAWYGFGASILMILAARLLHLLVGRPDDYYDEGPR